MIEASVALVREDTRQVRLLHSLTRTHASFDDPNLVSCAGLVPVMALAERAGLAELVALHVVPPARRGRRGGWKIGSLVAGMVAGADTIGDMDVLRHGAMTGPVRRGPGPSTLGSFLRAFTWGNVRQLDAVTAGCWRHWPAGPR